MKYLKLSRSGTAVPLVKIICEVIVNLYSPFVSNRHKLSLINTKPEIVFKFSKSIQILIEFLHTLKKKYCGFLRLLAGC